MIASAEIASASVASCRSLCPIAGPISETLSTVKGFPGSFSRRSFSTGSATMRPSRPVSDRSLMRRMFSPSTFCSVASPWPARVSNERISSRANGFWNFPWIDVPPARSIPRFAFPRKIWTVPMLPRISNTAENRKAYFRIAMKSYFGFFTSSIIASPSPLPLNAQRLHRLPGVEVVEHDLGADQGGEQDDRHADRERHGEPLDRPGAELEEDHRRDQRGHVGVDHHHERLVIPR